MWTVYTFIISLSFVLSNGSVSMHNPFYCYSEDPIRPQIAMFSSETPYESVRGRSIASNASTCIPSKFWLVSRQGTRLPWASEIEMIHRHGDTLRNNIVSNYNAGRTSLCAGDIALIRDWKFDPNITYDNAEFLTVTGWNEVQGIAQRYQLAFPTLLPPTYSLTDYLFRSMESEASTSSIAAFADGLFGYNGHQQVEFANIDNPDLLLSPHSHCSLFTDLISNLIEVDAFVDGPEYQEMITQVSNKLGFHTSRILSTEQIDTLHLICRFEQIWNINITSPLCAAFSIANQEVLEYSRDLWVYYRYRGFSNYRRLYENLPCHLIQHLLRFLRSNDPNDHKATIFHANSAVIGFAFAVFGAYEDAVPLHRHNFAERTFRLFRSSLITPKATNLAVIRFDCADGDNDVMFLHNEKPLQIPGCQSNGLCKLSMILDRFSRYLDVNCTEIFCTNS